VSVFGTGGITVLTCLDRNDVVNHLSAVDEMAQHIRTMIPMQILTDIDNSRNPMQLTKERIERAATENQFMNGKIASLTVSNDNRSLHMD
jgi:Transcription factor subunit Med10 of Mediator complex